LQQLVRDPSNYIVCQIHIQPGSVYLNLYESRNLFELELTAEQVVRWLNLLGQLAAAAEQRHGHK
jgi:hypothetical protein